MTNFLNNNINSPLDQFEIRDILNLEILDIGCGGGLLTEPMHRLGGKLTGIDASGKKIMDKNFSKKIKGNHLIMSELKIQMLIMNYLMK